MPAKSFAGGWRSTTKSSTSQSSRLAHTRRRSVAQRSFDAVATEGSVWTSGRNPIGRLFLCQPRRWKMRCTVFLLNPSRAATVRQPDESSSLIIALIDSAKRGYIFGAALTDLQYTVRGGIWNHWYSLLFETLNPTSWARSSSIASPYASCSSMIWRSYCSHTSGAWPAWGAVWKWRPARKTQEYWRKKMVVSATPELYALTSHRMPKST